MSIDPIELQNWCDSHPEYAEFKRKNRELRQELADKNCLSYEQLMGVLENIDDNEYMFENICK